MEIGKYLKEKQPIIYKTFANALKSNHLSHAYLVVGEHGTPLKETAIYLAKSIICDNPNPLACETCLTCTRVDEGNFADIIINDGEATTIKKEDVDNITESFSKTALEEKGKVIYVIHLVENMTIQAVNALLKFLEEPGDDTYAFLTTQNEARILPTIVSRSTKLKLKLLPRSEVIKDSLSIGVNATDAELLSYFYNNALTIKEQVETEDYIDSKVCFEDLLNALTNDFEEARFILDTKIINKISTKEKARFFLDMLATSFHDILSASLGDEIILNSYANIINELSKKLPHIQESLLEIMVTRSKLDLNLTVGTLLDHVIISIIKE